MRKKNRMKKYKYRHKIHIYSVLNDVTLIQIIYLNEMI